MRYPRSIAVRSSHRSLILIAATHLVAAISFAHLPFGFSACAGLVLVALSSVCSWHALRRNVDSCIELGDDGLLRFPERDAEGVPCGRLTDFGAVRWLVWQEDGGLRSRMLWRADCTAEDWRSLGVWLRHKTALRGAGVSDVA
ncbi:MAG: hypothetical protein LPJ87_10255 [Zoogloeaceae bacterium]|nr:hypothetical protein [Zoogloeaceae bacterium]